MEKASAYLDHFGFSGLALTDMLSKFIKIDGIYYLFCTADLWGKFTEQFRVDILDSLEKDPARQGLQVDITINAEDSLPDIAEKYAGGRDPKPVEELLRDLLQRSPNREVTIPLSKILQPFIQNNVDSYERCSGANCFGIGVSANRDDGYEFKEIGSERDLLNEVFYRYRFVNKNEVLNSGDLLIYRGPHGVVDHVSTYITDDIVFTKNGLNKLNPYLFQFRSANEAIYFPDHKYKLMVLRLPKKGEATADESRIFKVREVYFEDTISRAPQAGTLKTEGTERPTLSRILGLICRDVLDAARNKLMGQTPISK